MSDCVRGFVIVPLLLGCCLSGCSGNENQEPAISDSVFVEVLVDLHLVQAALDESVKTDSTLRDTVLQYHSVTEGQMAQTTAYYANHPDEYLLVYNRVVDRISEEEETSRKLTEHANSTGDQGF